MMRPEVSSFLYWYIPSNMNYNTTSYWHHQLMWSKRCVPCQRATGPAASENRVNRQVPYCLYKSRQCKRRFVRPCLPCSTKDWISQEDIRLHLENTPSGTQPTSTSWKNGI